MSKFKVRDKVVRTGKDYKDIKKGGIYVVSEVSRNSNKWSCAINLEGHYNKNGEFDYDGNSFELYEENSMNGDDNKIKVGDTVRLNSGVICCGLNHMTQYLIERVRCKSVVLEGKDGAYDESIFIKVKSNPELIGEILTPLEAAEAILNDEVLEEYSSSRGEWCSFSCNLHSITLSYLQQVKLRRKPKTVVINGVEVVAPAKKEDIEQYFYTVNFSENTVHTIDKIYINNNFKHYWSKEEDAQKALDAMLIPFNNLNKG